MPVAERNFYRTLIAVVAFFLALLAFGCAGYMLVEGWTWTDSLHMTVTTLSTVGFGEVRQLSQTGRIFTGVMIIMGVSATAYTFSTVAGSSCRANFGCFAGIYGEGVCRTALAN